MNVIAWQGEETRQQHKARAIARFFTGSIPLRRWATKARIGFTVMIQFELSLQS
jgi:hypothetical protein